MLGQGSFGTVFKAKQHVDKKFYALKIISMPKRKNAYEKFSREAEIMADINHKHVVRYITSWKQTVNLPAFRQQYGIDFDSDNEDESSSE